MTKKGVKRKVTKVPNLSAQEARKAWVARELRDFLGDVLAYIELIEAIEPDGRIAVGDIVAAMKPGEHGVLRGLRQGTEDAAGLGEARS